MTATLLLERNYPAQIEKERLDLHATQLAELAIQEDLNELTLNVEINVLSAVNEGGKAVFSNETSRKAEIKRQLAENPRARELAAQIELERTRRIHTEARIERLRGEHRQAIALLEYETASIALA
jgi:pyridoxine/pyridoxamine 5'-phosphate oxidase